MQSYSTTAELHVEEQVLVLKPRNICFESFHSEGVWQGKFDAAYRRLAPLAPAVECEIWVGAGRPYFASKHGLRKQKRDETL